MRKIHLIALSLILTFNILAASHPIVGPPFNPRKVPDNNTNNIPDNSNTLVLMGISAAFLFLVKKKI